MLKMIQIFCISLLLLISGCKSQGEPDSKANKLFQEGNEKYEAEDYNSAIKLYTQAIKLNPNHSMAYLKRGDCNRKIRRPNAAIKDYSKSIEINPMGAKSFYHRGTLKFVLGDKRGGCEDIEKSKALSYIPAEKFYDEHCK